MIVLWACILCALAVGVKAEIEVKEDADVQWSNSTNANNVQDKHPSLPDNVVLEININNETAVLNLQKNRMDDFEDVPVIVGENGTNRNWTHDRDEQFGVFTDLTMHATFSVTINNKNGSLTTEYFGSFAFKDLKYSMMPKTQYEGSNKSDVVVYSLFLNGTEHVVFKDSDDTKSGEKGVNCNTGEKDLTSKYVEDLNDRTIEDGTSNSTRSLRRKRAAYMNLVIDLLIVIDYSMFSKWLSFNNNNRDETIERIRYYLAHVINGVNNVYATMKSHRLSVSVVGIYMAESKEQSDFSESGDVHIYKNKFSRMSYEQALSNFVKWLGNRIPSNGESLSNTKFLPENDIAAGFTNYEESPTEGLAYVGTVCKSHSAGIIHEKGQFHTITVVAHELGHVLGSHHDSLQKGCDPKDHYLMSPEMSTSHLENRDTFSPCTSRYVEEKVDELERTGKNCMDASKKKKRQKESMDHHLKTHPGLVFTPDQQCQMRLGEGYRFCSVGKDTHKTICNSMMCYKEGVCQQDHPIAMDGTFCGNGKWCIRGECVPGKPSIRTNKDTCIFGDKMDDFKFNGKRMNCKDLRNSSNICYTISDWCCETCEQIKKEKGIPGCDYGDKPMNIRHKGRVYGCELVPQIPDYCSEDPIVASECCESCRRGGRNNNNNDNYNRNDNNFNKNNHFNVPFAPPNKEVPNGQCTDNDPMVNGKKFYCSSLLSNPAPCYDVHGYCCKTCSEIKRRKGLGENCPYGDEEIRFMHGGKHYDCSAASWNRDICRAPNVAKFCCETCSNTG